MRRLAFVEYYAAHLQMVSAVHRTGARKSAMKLFGDEHLNIYELVKWACSSPPPASATLYSELLWTSVDVLSIRLDDDEKRIFCEVRTACGCTHGGCVPHRSMSCDELYSLLVRHV
jgi:hypothetical protein